MRKYSMPDWFFFILLVILTLAFYRVISPFIIDVLIGSILANQFWGVFKWLQKKFKNNKSAASVMTVAITFLVIVVPLFVVGYIVSTEAIHAFSTVKERLPEIQQSLSSEGLRQRTQQIPVLRQGVDLMYKYNLQQKVSEGIPQLANYMLGFLQSTLSNIYYVVFHFFIILLLLYFLFVDGEALLIKIRNISPLNDEDEDELLQETVRVTDGTIKGAFIISLIEAVIGSIVFFVFGIPSVAFWGVVMFVAAIIPAGGSGLVYVPVGIFQIIIGHYISGIGLIILSLVIPNFIQNIVKPKLLGNRIGLNPALILLTTIGGLIWFGLIGFLIGPLIGSLFIAVWNQFGRRYKDESEKNNNG
ncbi:MAG: hypothetical protein DKM50_09880 [Candidatus Margulisiibacteriota bacterium]|nr:MAG: hypothetical protein A2X43_03965 [Candidatus Margulisbacteria bacterium GWD2_39_127]OGI05158.1 MAG: hypothetical protein A2X42_02475 [Candidatus Margulisbacteria bacterium GWF2_38_17]OGI06207.1 MAG: hypothetical protein A2X41_08055 [Candidatus Margulisbacteria bacterium GWE2_39_32]PZM78863.1 MAG: hypothetical protein DKM50_09880 [Candidatus Margulisiibacteriota bacterium]HAR64557.1 hypothetical protein [Candidatus Margulisiibacteriota bacterium]